MVRAALFFGESTSKCKSRRLRYFGLRWAARLTSAHCESTEMKEPRTWSPSERPRGWPGEPGICGGMKDRSTDGSGQAGAAAGARLLTLPTNRGKAAALNAGLRWAAQRGYCRMLTCDADGQHPLAEALRLAEAAGPFFSAPPKLLPVVLPRPRAPVLSPASCWASLPCLPMHELVPFWSLSA